LLSVWGASTSCALDTHKQQAQQQFRIIRETALPTCWADVRVAGYRPLEADELIECYRHLVRLTDPEKVAVPSRSIVLAQNYHDHLSAEARDQ
jgi:hypothetical protein